MGRKPRPRPLRLPAKLLALRLRLNLSQPEVAKRLGASSQRVSEWESGRREPNVLVLLRYARLAKVPVESLIDDEKKCRSEVMPKRESDDRRARTIQRMITAGILVNWLR